jgi:hypothetical protein
VGDTWIWKYYNPQTPDNYYYLKVSVTSKNSTAITVSGRTYDPVTNNETQFDDIAPNFVYSTEQLHLLATNSSYNPSNVTRTYANRTVTALRFNLDADNVAYIDWNTGVLLEAILNLGSTKVNFEIVSWTNQNMEIYRKPAATGNLGVPGYPLEIVILLGVAGFGLIIKKTMKKDL